MIPGSTMYIPGLYGQSRVWRQNIIPLSDNVEKLVSFGSIVGLSDWAKGNKYTGYNVKTVMSVEGFAYTSQRFTQLIGPTDILALCFPGRYVSDSVLDILFRWWLQLDSRVHTAAVSDDGRLLTHGGLTYGQWLDIEKPQTAHEAAERLNDKYDGVLFPGESYRLSGRVNMHADPIFADPYREFYASWLGQPSCPFDQIHASGDFNTPVGRRWLTSEYSCLNTLSEVRYTAYGSVVRMGEAQMTAVDLLCDRDEPLKTLDATRRNMLVTVPDDNDEESEK